MHDETFVKNIMIAFKTKGVLNLKDLITNKFGLIIYSKQNTPCSVFAVLMAYLYYTKNQIGLNLHNLT